MKMQSENKSQSTMEEHIVSDIIKFRELIGDGYSISHINVNNLGQTVIKFITPQKCQAIDGQFYVFSTQDQSVIQKANEIFKKNKTV
jgi:hypothetical protein